MRRLLVFQVLILFICAVVYPPALSAEKIEKEYETIGIQKYKSSELSPSATQQENDPIVYITKTGEKYHRGSCGCLRHSRISIRLSEAKRKGYTACLKCKPPK